MPGFESFPSVATKYELDGEAIDEKEEYAKLELSPCDDDKPDDEELEAGPAEAEEVWLEAEDGELEDGRGGRSSFADTSSYSAEAFFIVRHIFPDENVESFAVSSSASFMYAESVLPLTASFTVYHVPAATAYERLAREVVEPPTFFRISTVLALLSLM